MILYILPSSITLTHHCYFHCYSFRDYEALPELDRYEESHLAPNTDFGLISHEDRRRAEELMDDRDNIENMYGRQGVFRRVNEFSMCNR